MTLMEKIDSVIVETAPEPDACMIWLHGLGADGHDFEPIAEELQLPGRLRYVFPHAPVRPVTINGGRSMRAWYDIASPELSTHPDLGGIRHSSQLVNRLIDIQIEKGLSPGRIVLGGFSQGGVVALECGLRRSPPLAGIVALSTYVACADTLPRSTPDSPPILMMHGSMDPIVPLSLAEESRGVLDELGYSVEWHVFTMPHSVCAEEISILRRWLMARLY